jgi:NAD(P)-dependent dehydrogenase (short-subunit alcohol dehydrogenase family)
LDFDKIDGLILNAATKSRKYKKNSEGVELSLATNHFGHFLLLGLLMPKLLQQPGLTKIVFVGTDIAAKDRQVVSNLFGIRGIARAGSLRFFSLILKLDALNDARYKRKFLSMTEELDAENGKYDMHAAYKYSKAMQLLFARELAERLKGAIHLCEK